MWTSSRLRRDLLEAENRWLRLSDRVDRLIEQTTENTIKAESAMRAIESFRLDYEALYEKVRSNLAKAGKAARAAEAEAEGTSTQDQVANARQALLSRKLSRKG